MSQNSQGLKSTVKWKEYHHYVNCEKSSIVGRTCQAGFDGFPGRCKQSIGC